MAGFGAKVKLTVNDSKSAQQAFQAEINNLIKNAKLSKINISKNFTVSDDEIQRLATDISSRLEKKQIKIRKIDASPAISGVKKQLESMFSALSLKHGVNITGLKEFVDTNGMKEVSSEIQGALTTLNNVSKTINSQYGTALSKGSSYKELNAELTALLPKLNEYNAKVAAARTVGSVTTPEDIANIQAEGIALSNNIAQIQQKITAINQEEAASKRASKSKQTDGQNEIASLKQVTTLYKQVTSFKNSNTRIQKSDKLSSSVEFMLRKLETGSKMTKAELDALQQEFAEIQAEALKTGNTGKSAIDRIGAAYKKFGGWSIITRSLTAAYRVVKQMVTNVVELDTAMTELKKVTNETDSVYEKFLDNAATRAKKLGATVSDIVTASADFARLGFNLEEAEKLADAATVYKNVGDGITDISTASESIIATMQAFGVEANDAMSIVDKFNNVGNNYAISSKGVGDALLRSAAAMKAANNTLDETIALAAAANTVVQDPEKVGTTLKTVSMFLRAAKTDAEAAGESTEGMANSISELREEILALTGGAVDIQIDENTYKSTFEILQELSKVYDKLTDVSQANLLELLGGKRNSNVVAALLENFTVAEEALATSADSAGSAMAENEKYLDSINGKISIFKASFEELSNNFIDSEFIKGIVDSGTKLLGLLNIVGSFIEKIGGLGNILKVLVPVVGLLNAGQITDFVSSLKVVEGITSTLKAIPQAANGAHNYLLKFLNLFWSGNGILSSFGVTLKSLWTNMSLFSKLTWITIAITAVIKIIDTFVVTTEEANEKLKESKIEYQESTDKLESLNKELQTTNERISELQSKGKLSFTEQEELNRLQQLNQELRTNIDLEQTKLDIASKQRSNDLIDFHKSYTQTRSNLWLDSFGNLTFISDAEKLRSLYAEYTAQMASGFLEQANQTSTKISNIVSEIINAIDGISYIENPQTELDKKHNTILDSLNKVILSYNIFSGQEGAKGKALDFLTSNPYKEVTQSLTELGKAGQVTATTLQNDSYDDFINTAISMKIITDDSAESLAFLASYFNDVGDTAEDSANKISNLSTETQSYISTLEGIQSLSAGLDQLDKIYADIYNKEDFDWGSIFNNKEFTDTFSGFTEEYEEFIKTVSNSPNDIKACQAAFNNLTTAYLSTCKELQNVTDETRNATVAFLEQKGVANAAAIVDAQLALNKEKVRLESQGVTAASTTEAVAILEAAEASETERVALAQLLIEKIRVNQITIDTSGDIANLIALAEQAGATTSSIANLIKAKELLALAEGIEANGALGVSADADINQALIGSLRARADELKNAPITYNPSKNATYTGGSATNSAKDAAAKNQKTWFDKQLAEHKHRVAMDKETEEEYLNWLDSAYKKAYKEGKIDLEDYYKYEEEVYNGRKDLFKDHLNDTEHKISVLSNTSGNEEEIKTLYKNLIGDIEVELFKARERGLDETDDYYQELLDKQQSYYDELESIFEDHLNDTEHKISMLEEFDSQDEEVIKLYQEMLRDIEAELADARARGLDENDEYIQTLEKDWQDCYDKLFGMFKDHLNDIDHEISMRENYDGDAQEIIKLHEQAKLDIEKQIADLRAQGYTDNDEEIQYLQEQWHKHNNAIVDMREDAAKDAKDAVDDLVDYKVQMLKQEIQDEKEALNKKLDNLREFYDKQKEMLQDQYDEEKYLEEQAEKRKTVSDIEAELAMLEYDDSAWAQKRKLELKEELIAAQKELDDFEEEKALDLALDAIDDAAEAQTKQLEAEMDALDERLNDPNALYNQALAAIVNNTGNLYAEMHAYNNKHGSGNPDDVDEKYDNAYEALDKYEDVYGESYNNIELPNKTNNQSSTDSWDNASISGTNPENKTEVEPNLPPTTASPTPESFSSSESDDDEFFMRGSIVQVNPTTTNFSSKSGNKKMSSDVPGGVYTIMEIDGIEAKIGKDGKAIGWVRLADLTILDSYGTSDVEFVVVPESSGSTSGSSNSSAPSLSKGATVTIKTSATHFGSKSKGTKMASWVPGSNFTVMGTSGDQVQIGRDGVVTGWVKKSDIVGYASGSNYTKAGLAQIFEEGYEQIFTSVDGNKYKLFNAGDKVLNAKATEFLYDFAESGGAIINNILARLLYGNMPNLASNNAKLMDIHLGDIIIQGNADNRTVSEIRRAQRDNIDYILTEFSKLNR